MRNLKYAILCLLRRGPMTGYDLAKEFSSALANFWNASHSQIYPELKKMTDEGLITFDTVIQGEKLEKKMYTLTDAGLAEHRAWMDRLDDFEPTGRDIFRLKAFFMDAWSAEERTRHFAHQLGQRQKRLASLRAEERRLFAGRGFAQLNGAEQGDYTVLQGAIMQAAAYVRWLEESLEMF